MTVLPRHRTPSERRAAVSAQAAIARALAHVKPPPTDPPPEPWPPSPAVWRQRCREIRQEIEQERNRPQ